MRLPQIRILVTLLVTITAASAAGATTLVVRGRTADAEGFPIEKVRVRIEGPKGASTLSDEDGRFTLAVPLPALVALDQGATPRIAIRAERKGWRFAVASGDPRLAVELAVETEGGLKRSMARSNEPRLAAAAARALADGRPTGPVSVMFLGAEGEPEKYPPWPILEHVARASLASPGEASAAMPPTQEAPSPAQPPPNVVPIPVPRGTPEPTPAPRATKPARKADKQDARRVEREPRGSAWGLASRRERAVRDSLEAVRKAEREERRLARIQEQGGRAIGDREPDPRMRLPLPSPMPTAEPRLEPTPPPSAKKTTVRPTPSPRASRSRARPLVIRTGVASPKTDSCRCRIGGTIEIQSEQPLKSRERIEISLQGRPQYKDVVEMFMGSPRPFVLGEVPCGTQRLKIRFLTGGRFDVISREALFRCEGGRLIQPRVILRPR